MTARKPTAAQTPLLEWIAAGIGALVLLVLVAAIGRDALTGDPAQSPSVRVAVTGMSPSAVGHVVTIEAINEAGGTAAALQTEGLLSREGREVERSVATIDYVSGHGRAAAGLYFRQDPWCAQLVVRAIGYQQP